MRSCPAIRRNPSRPAARAVPKGRTWTATSHPCSRSWRARRSMFGAQTSTSNARAPRRLVPGRAFTGLYGESVSSARRTRHSASSAKQHAEQRPSKEPQRTKRRSTGRSARPSSTTSQERLESRSERSGLPDGEAVHRNRGRRCTSGADRAQVVGQVSTIIEARFPSSVDVLAGHADSMSIFSVGAGNLRRGRVRPVRNLSPYPGPR